MSAPTPRPWKLYPADEDRPAYAAGLRHMADLIEAGTIPIPTGGVDLFVAFGPTPSEEQARAARDITRALGGGRWNKNGRNGSTLLLEGMCGGVPVRVYVDREAVCERVVVGRETVEVPAQPAVEAHTVEQDVVEWRCSPLLAAADKAVTS